MKEELQKIGAIFKQRRNDLNLSQTDLAEKCGLHYRTILRIEKAILWPNLKQYLKICEALNIESKIILK